MNSPTHPDPTRPPTETAAGLVSSRLRFLPTTSPGSVYLDTIEELAPRLAEGAAKHDAAGSFPFESLDALKDAGIPWAPIPTASGGLDLRSVRDVLAGAVRLAEADPALALGLNMHLVTMLNLSHTARVRDSRGDHAAADAIRGRLEALAERRMIVVTGYSEPDQHLQRLKTTARRDGDGWLVSGTKVFCTMSPAADIVVAAVTYWADDGAERLGFAQIPTSAEGVTILDDWDALGMRGSGSNSVAFDDVRLPATALTDAFPAGRFSTGFLDRFVSSGLFHTAAALGVAEAAHAHIVADGARRSGLGRRARSTTALAENVIDLHAARSVLSSTGVLVDEYQQRAIEVGAPGFDDAADAFVAAQLAKTTIDRIAVRVVDRSIELSGGVGYRAASPLAKAWRDVRASALMHPLGANRAFDLVAAAEIGSELPTG